MIRIVRRNPCLPGPSNAPSDRRRRAVARSHVAPSFRRDEVEELESLRHSHLYLLIRQMSLAALQECHDRALVRRDRRHAVHHATAIAIYLAHVVARMSMYDLAAITGRHRTSISHVIALIEDRRDDAGYDALVAMIEERMKVLLPGEEADHD